MMNCKSVSILAAVAFATTAVVATPHASQDSSLNMAELETQLKRNEEQIIELKEKIEKLESRLGNVEVGLGKTQSELEWKVQPLTSKAQ